MADIDQELARMTDEALASLHVGLDESDPFSPADAQAHHLVTTEILRRGGSHGHDGDEWSKAVILVDSAEVESAEDVVAPDGMEKAWSDALAGGGTVSVLLTVNGYVMKAYPTVSDVHVDAVMGKPRRRRGKRVMVDESDDVEKRGVPEVLSDLEQNLENRQHAIDEYLYGPMNPEEPGDYWKRLGEVWDVTAAEAATTRCGNCSAFNVSPEIRTAMAEAIGEGGDQVVASADLGYCELLDFKCAASRSCSAWLTGGPINDGVAKHGTHNQLDHGNWAGPGDGSLNLNPDVKQRIKETLGNGQIASEYGDGYAQGKAHAKGEDIYGEKLRYSPTQNGKRLTEEKKKRDSFADQLMKAPRGGMLAENLAANTVAAQGFIDGAIGSKPNFRRNVTLGETIGSLLSAGPSGAFKSAEWDDVAKHGSHDQSSHGSWARGGSFGDLSPELAKAAKKLAGGGSVTVDAKDVPAVIDAMGDMKKNVDLTNLHIRGNDIFDEGNLGIARENMPQIPKTKAPKFVEEMRASGVSVTEKSVDPLTLKPTQHELNAVEVAGIAEAMRTGNFHSTNKLFVSNDGYILDGHHRWAAGVVEAIRTGDRPLPVAVVDLPIRELLKVAEEFHIREGIDRRTMSDVTKALIDEMVREYDELVLEPAFKHGSHDQSSHGNWASGGAGPTAGGRGSGAKTTGGGGAGGGSGQYSATYSKGVQKLIDSKPDEITFNYDPQNPGKSETLKKGEHSAWHHVIPNPDAPGGYSLTPERQALWDKEIAAHLDGVPTGREAPVFVMMGGGGGAGKGTLLSSGKLDGAIPDGGMTKGEHVKIDVDEIKGHFPEYKKMVDDEKKTEVASYVHEESSMIGKIIQDRAVKQGSHVVLDGTGDAGAKSLRGKLDAPRRAGYRLVGEYVTAPVRTGVREGPEAGAWERNIERAASSPRGLVPADALLAAHRSVSEIVPDIAGDFDEFRLRDTGKGRGGVVIATATRGRKLKIVDQALYDEFEAKKDEKLTADEMMADVTEDDIRRINAAK